MRKVVKTRMYAKSFQLKVFYTVYICDFIRE